MFDKLSEIYTRNVFLQKTKITCCY